MSGKIRQKTAANDAESVNLSLNERILKKCHQLYTDPEHGLIQIAASVGLNLLAPRKKISVLLIGNHSAGKSSFINWYIEEHVQRTGVAIETQGFSFVTSGRKRESLTGNATLHLYPHFEPLRSIEGIVDYLNTEISTSKQKKFSLVTFVDTPGLVDGDMKYPFDVNKAILWLGDIADLIFIFFDPIGQALCKRTLSLVEKLNEKHAERMRFYLSKADEAGHEADRQRVMMQIVQELCKRPGLNRTGFDMPTIYIPNPSGKPSRCVNQIEDVCKDIEKTINQTVQNTLNTLERDCNRISHLIEETIQKDSDDRAYNFRARMKGFLFYAVGFLLPLLLVVDFIASSASKDFLNATLGASGTDALHTYLAPVRGFWSVLPEAWHLYAWGVFLLVTAFLLILAKITTKKLPTLSRRQKRELSENSSYVQKFVKDEKQKLYQEYLQQSVAEHDL